MTERAWKRAERFMARDVGTQRIPVTGERAGSDFSTSPFCFQLKVRKMLPRFLFDWLDGICATASRTDKIGVLVLNVPRRHRRRALVVVRWADWVALHGTSGAPIETPEEREEENHATES